MDELRFSRLEDKVDDVQSDVTEIKTKQAITSHTMDILQETLKENTEIMKQHIAGDTKIIDQIMPILQSLPDITEVVSDYKYDRETRKRKLERRKEIAAKIAIIGGTLGAMFTALKILAFF